MPRNRASAKKAGTSFERLVADYLKQRLNDDRIDRRVKTGNKDRGDIGGGRTIRGARVSRGVDPFLRWPYDAAVRAPDRTAPATTS